MSRPRCRRRWRIPGRPANRMVAVLAAATALGFPLVVILLRLWLTGSVAAGGRPAGFVAALRLLRWATRWSMVEVFLLGILIAVVRSAGIAGVVAGPALFSYVALAMLLAAEQESGAAPAVAHSGRSCRGEPRRCWRTDADGRPRRCGRCAGRSRAAGVGALGATGRLPLLRPGAGDRRSGLRRALSALPHRTGIRSTPTACSAPSPTCWRRRCSTCRPTCCR